MAARERPRPARSRLGPVLVVLTVIAAAATVGAVVTGADHASSSTTSTVRHLTTPVLSARRVGPLVADRIADAALRPALDTFLVKAPPQTCLSVAAVDHVAYEHNPDLAVAPASTQKLVTSTVLLDQLGPETRLRTKVVAANPPSGDGTVDGDLWLVGGGDPLLETKDYAGHFFDQPQLFTPLESLADAVATAGVKHVAGRVVGDESRYDGLRVVPSWSPRFTAQHQLGPLSALNVNDNVRDWPSRQQPLTPDGVGVSDPPSNAAERFRSLLQERGVSVDGGGGNGAAPANGRELAGVDSLPVRDLVREMLLESDNQTAEILLKELGRVKGGAPTTAAGLAVVKTVAPRLGLPANGLAPVDGSGLDDNNRETCRILLTALTRSGPSPLVPLLAVAGQTGTLTTRFKGSPVAGRLRAKTGSLNSVSSLAGQLPTAKGETVTFAFVQNGPNVDTRLQDQLVAILDTYPNGPTAAELSPLP